MKKLMLLNLIVLLTLAGCSNEINPDKVTKTDFSNLEAEIIMKRAWEPINKMIDSNNEIRPNIKISSKEDFFESYDFSYMDERYMYGTIFESIVNLVYDEESKTEKETKDNEGNIIFKEGKYIPTIYDEGIVIEKAYIRDSRYSEKYSNLNVVELIVIENSNEKVNKYAYGFNRTNIFRYNEKGEWILYSIEGDISISR